MFEFILKRKAGYYDLNIVVPTFATASLMIFTLFIPWDSGERISYAVTVFLSIIVFLLILSENLPKTNTQSILSKMLVGLTFFSLFIVFITIVISALYSRSNTKCPKFLRKIFGKGCIEILEVTKKESNREMERYNSYNMAMNTSDLSSYDKDSINSEIKKKEKETISFHKLAYLLEKVFTGVFLIIFIIFASIMFSK